MTSSESVPATVRDVVQALEREANVRAVFGEPLVLGEHRIVPVAVVSIGGGGASAKGRGPAVGTSEGAAGGGATALGLAVNVVPLGFIHESKSGEVVYTAIHGAHAALEEHEREAHAGGTDAGRLGARILAALRKHG